MTQALIWLHDEALRITHPVFASAPAETKAVFIWDDEYFRTANYSLKRLIFIYETLCELPLEIVRGNVLQAFSQLNPTELYVPTANQPLLRKYLAVIETKMMVHQVPDEAFATFKKSSDSKRFFQYWNKAEKTAFLHNGDADA
jgi:hypothetical protein